MKLLTEELRVALPALYAQEGQDDPMIVAKFFGVCALGAWTWNVLEGSPVDADGIMIKPSNKTSVPVDFLFFGLVVVVGECTEMGYFSLSELEAATMSAFPLVERDLYWKPCPLSSVNGS